MKKLRSREIPVPTASRITKNVLGRIVHADPPDISPVIHQTSFHAQTEEIAFLVTFSNPDPERKDSEGAQAHRKPKGRELLVIARGDHWHVLEWAVRTCSEELAGVPRRMIAKEANLQLGARISLPECRSADPKPSPGM
ncbi:uncharacterized protein LOC108588901 [Callithrix jacchus]